MGASVLPVTIHNGKILFLFGKERDDDENPGWADFGGGNDAGESALVTATREAGEEFTGFLGDQKQIKQLLKHNYKVEYPATGKFTKGYTVHIIPLEYDPKFVEYFNNNAKFIHTSGKVPKQTIKDCKVFEKTQIKWFSFKEIKNMIKHFPKATNNNNFRGFYNEVAKLIVSHEDGIELFVKKQMGNKKTNKTIRVRKNNKKTKKR
jgi:hypothetical protein